jgi:hypothetical protein
LQLAADGSLLRDRAIAISDFIRMEKYRNTVRERSLTARSETDVMEMSVRAAGTFYPRRSAALGPTL